MILGYVGYILCLCEKWLKVTCSSCFVNRNCSSFIGSRFGMLPSQPHACGSSHSTVSSNSHEPPIQQNNFTVTILDVSEHFEGSVASATCNLQWFRVTFSESPSTICPSTTEPPAPMASAWTGGFCRSFLKRDKANNMVDMIILRQFTSLVRIFNFFWLMMAWHVMGCWAGLLSTSVDPVWAKEIRIDLMICMEYGGFLQRRTHFCSVKHL